ncbi:CDP-glucose 4,6-dehydratase [Hoeflea sp. IMCC20628]|uniref:CDP-glucose 4,6-dehydratase n=1 Tax=Hoeflea sp. IMCC20628 TaxID=1620421 RepID=UPI00063BF4BB|nr:CDP-glucose 4,6-dehydratase [Hoeflea sp. IMCC20628]AKI02357.1 CDP-glucose 4,6-dehydratase [Hoeflea sp. IMCC20628]
MEKLVTAEKLASEAKAVNQALPDPDFWRGRKVLLTGHTGFKGSWLLYWLEAMGADVTGCSLPPEQPSALFPLLHSEGRLSGEIADIRDAQQLTSLVERAQPEIVLHLAAQSLVRRSYADPVGTFATNVTGTNNLLQALAKTGTARAIVVTTTDKVYKNSGDGHRFRENDPLGGEDPYSASKAACEMVVAGWRAHFEDSRCGIATARAGNVIGGGDWAEDRLFPDAVRSWSKGEILSVRRPLATRPWQHVLEPLRGYLVLAERLASGADLAPAYNFGPTEDSATVRDVLTLAACHFGGAGIEYAEILEGPAEAEALALDPSLAASDLAISGLWGLDQTVALTARWYRELLGGRSGRDLCEEDCSTYFEAASRASSGVRR